MDNNALLQIHHLLMEGITFQKLMNLGEELLHTPISCSDTSFYHRALSKGYPEKALEERNFHRSTTSAEEYFESTLLPYQQVHDNHPFILHPNVMRRTLICKNYIAGQHVGHLAIPECDIPLEQLDIDLIKVLSDACALCYALQSNTENLSSLTDPEQSIFEALLQGDFTSEEAFRLRARHYTFERSLVYRMLVITLPKSHSSVIPLLLQNTTHRVGGYSWHLYRENELLLLYAHDPGKDFQTPFFENLARLCERYDLYVCVSDAFTTPMELKKHYERVRRVHTFLPPDPQQRILYYDQCKTDYALSVLLAQSADLRDYCDSALLQLAAFDKENGAELCNTLFSYLSCGMSPTKTASELFIHKNTVLYRIRQIQDLTALTLDNPEMTLPLLLSLRLLKLYAKEKE